MNVFLSWSGDRSKAAALAFRDWLPDVIQTLQPWMSSEDIRSGTGWNGEIRNSLDRCDFGIIFITRDNMTSPWLMFEAGALAKRVETSRVVPLIVDSELKLQMLTGPLGQLQAREATEDNIRRLLKDLNFSAAVNLDEMRVDRCFNAFWPKLKEKLDNLPAAIGPKPTISTDDMLIQIIGLLKDRNQSDLDVNADRASRRSMTRTLMRNRKLKLGDALSALGLTKQEIVSAVSLFENMPAGANAIKFESNGRRFLLFGDGFCSEIRESS